MRGWDRRAPLLCGVVAFSVYLAGAAPGVGFFDGGELTAAAWGLGVSHPPGQPLYSMLGKAVCLLPLGGVAFRLNVLSAAGGAAAVSLLVALASTLGLGPAGSLVAAGALAASPLCVEQATRAEVYAPCLALLLAAALFVARAIGDERKGGTPSPAQDLAAAALLLGLAAAIHPLLAAATALPLAAAGAWRLGARRAVRSAPLAIGAAVLGLATYAYVRVAAGRHPAVDWGGARTIAAFWATVSARAYAHNFSLGRGAMAGNLAALIALLAVGTSGPALLAGALGAAWVATRRRRPSGLLAGGLVVAILGFTAAQGQIFPENPDVAGYVLPALAGLALGLGALASALVAVLPAALSGRGRSLVARGVALAILALAVLPARRRADPLPTKAWDAEDYAAALLSALPARPSLLLAASDHAIFPLVYEQAVAGARPDVAVVSPELLTSSWYLEDLARAHPDLFVPWVDDGGRRDDLAGRLIAGNIDREPILSELYTAGGWPPWRTRHARATWTVRERGVLFALLRGGPGQEDPGDRPLPPLTFHGEMGHRIAAFVALEHARYRAEADPRLDPLLYTLRAPDATPVFLYDVRQASAWQGDLDDAMGREAQGDALLEQSLQRGFAPAGFALALHRLDGGDTVGADRALAQAAHVAVRARLDLFRVAGLLAVDRPRPSGPDIACAERWLGRVLAERPEDEPANVTLGELAGQRSDYRDAVARFRAALRGDPTSVPALAGLGLALARSGHTRAATTILRRALALDPSRGDIRAFLAMLAAHH